MPGVLAAVDLSEVTDRVVDRATDLAAALRSPLYLLHVAPEEPILAGYDKEPISAHTRADRAGELASQHARLRELAAGAEAQGVQVHPLLHRGTAVETALDQISRTGADWLVVGSHGHGGLHHLLVGSVTEGLVRRSKVPVVVVPPPGRR